MAYPPDGARYALDPDIPPELQTIELVAHARDLPPTAEIRFYVDDVLLGASRAPFRAEWRLVEGRHVVEARLVGVAPARATIAVH